MRNMDCFFEQYKETEIKKIQPEEIDALENSLESIFIYCLIWSVGCTVDYEGREKFDQFLKKSLKTNSANVQFPDPDLPIYEFQYLDKTKAFQLWRENFANFEVDQRLMYHEIMIPTTDSTRNSNIAKMLLVQNYHVMYTGPTGTGKSLNAYRLLGSGMSDTY